MRVQMGWSSWSDSVEASASWHVGSKGSPSDPNRCSPRPASLPWRFAATVAKGGELALHTLAEVVVLGLHPLQVLGPFGQRDAQRRAVGFGGGHVGRGCDAVGSGSGLAGCGRRSAAEQDTAGVVGIGLLPT